jgi:long-subunit acyl-CoA synthetase (AMP-forming)
VVKGKLSVQSGELTANLKLRRPKVEARYAELISALYAGADSHSDAMHVGGEVEK